MKMISRTSITSTSGTTLISESADVTRGRRRRPPPPPWPDAPLGITLGMRSSYVKFRSAMVRNSIEKSSIAVANCFTWSAK